MVRPTCASLPASSSSSSAAVSAAASAPLAGSSVTVSGHVGGRPLLLNVVVLLVVSYSLAVVEALEALLVDGGEVDEDIVGAVGGGDEAEPLVAEELDGALVSHGGKK